MTMYNFKWHKNYLVIIILPYTTICHKFSQSRLCIAILNFWPFSGFKIYFQSTTLIVAKVLQYQMFCHLFG
ncbi:hypothetical protein HanRHA438_Chr08g0370751 [Helianthus annuus]|nr:hypothetical protein HanRHA438_Chr08g0370751 [Helianthus annuus]